MPQKPTTRLERLALGALAAGITLTGCRDRSQPAKHVAPTPRSCDARSEPTKQAPSVPAPVALPSQVLVWTPSGVVTLASWSNPAETVASASPALRAPLSSTRQLRTKRAVGIAVDGVHPATRAGTLVSFDPAHPADAIELGKASSWFPAHDGKGVWRVHQVAGGFPGVADVAYEVDLYGLDGRGRTAPLRLSVGDVPVAALANGLAVERPAPPARRYPCDLGSRIRTAIGGTTYDLVAIDPSGHTTRRISDYTAVRRSAIGGAALVVNSDPNVKVRPTEALNLDTGRRLDAAPVELVSFANPQPRQTSDGASGAVSVSMTGLQTLNVDRLGGPSIQASASLPNDNTYDRRLAFNVQSTLQRDALLLFPEATSGGVVLVAWDVGRGQALGRSAAVLPQGSFPIGVVD